MKNIKKRDLFATQVYIDYNKNKTKFRKKYNIVGEGSARIVIKYSPNIVMKFAKDIKGLWQNEVEYDIYYSNRHKNLGSILSISSSDNQVFAIFMKYYPKRITLITINKRKKLLKSLYDNILINYNFEQGIRGNDLSHPSSWRKTKSNKLLLVDYGYSNKVNLKYRDDKYNIIKKRYYLK